VNRAQSESIGVILLAGVIVLSVGAFGAFYLPTLDDGTDRPLFSIEGDTDPPNVTITHAGGDSVGAGELRLSIEVNGSRVDYIPRNEEFTPGETWAVNVSEYANVSRGSVVGVTLYHLPSESRLYSEEWAVREEWTQTSTVITTTTSTETETSTATPTPTATATPTPTATPSGPDTTDPTIESFEIIADNTTTEQREWLFGFPYTVSKANITVSWEVSDNRNIADVSITMEQRGLFVWSQVDAASSSASTAGETTLVQDEYTGSNTYRITITVTDEAGNTASETIEFEAG